MNLEVTFRNLNPRAEVRERAQALFKKLERFLDASSEGSLTVAIDHGAAIVELVLRSHGQTHKISEEDPELRAALDNLFHRMENQLRRAKERRVDRWQKGNEKDAEDGLPRVETGEEYVRPEYADSAE